MLSFENTEVAFSDRTNPQLKKARFLFTLVKNPLLVKIGSVLLLIANQLHFSLKWILRDRVFSHFCGGETLQECKPAIDDYAQKNIKTILDYSAEGIESEKEFDLAKERIIENIKFSKQAPDIAFAVFKFSGIGRFELLRKVNDELILSFREQEEYDRICSRADEICRAAVENNLPVMIDAEESWVQDTIDLVVEGLMEKYNKDFPYVYNTLQMYRIDKLFYLKKTFMEAKEKSYVPAFKLVRGAYMEKERARASKYQYGSPIHPDKESTDRAFNEAVRFCLENIHGLAVCIGTHNEESCYDAIHVMDKYEVEKDHPRVFFSQLMGMSDHISYNLAKEGYNVSKYVPYGPLRMVMPYLIRRAEENTSVAGQTGRELYLIKKELKRRRSSV